MTNEISDDDEVRANGTEDTGEDTSRGSNRGRAHWYSYCLSVPCRVPTPAEEPVARSVTALGDDGTVPKKRNIYSSLGVVHVGKGLNVTD